MTTSQEAQLKNSLKSLKTHPHPLTDTWHFHSCNHQKWLPKQILGGKTANSVQIDPSKNKGEMLLVNTKSFIT